MAESIWGSAAEARWDRGPVQPLAAVVREVDQVQDKVRD